MQKNGKKKETVSTGGHFPAVCASVVSGIITIFVVLLVTVFPLIYRHAYFDILETKYQCYYVCVIGMLVFSLMAALIMLAIDLARYGGKNAKALFARLHPHSWKQTFCAADVAVLVFWLIALISTFQSDYFYESFWGNEGRYTGLFLLTLYVAAYFVISRFWKMKGWVLELFLISGMIVCAIGITDYFELDILNFRGKIKPEQSTIFTSTMGNINTYTAYVGLLMGFSAGMFAAARSVGRQIWYYLCLTVCFFAIIMGCSDNAYLALMAMFGLLPFVMFRTWKGTRRYLLMLAGFFTVVQCIDWINICYEDMVIGLDSLFGVITGFGGLLYIVIALWLIVAACYYTAWKTRARGIAVPGSEEEKRAMLWGRRRILAWGIFAALVIFAGIAAFYDVNVGGNAQRYGALGRYLLFDDSWGTNRGYIWKMSIALYKEFPLRHKLFGYGPDTFGILTTNKIFRGMIDVSGQIYDSAHNEYLQYFVTIGPFGLIAYLVFLGSSVLAMLKNYRSNIYLFGALSAVICYAFQALVNINLPIASPIMWLVFSIAAAACREARKKQMAV
ncbi:MAG: O-antigen ligase family protein [Clostridiales bacterium]|nr:O-antigen ligase family protein [Clostridiales bacterium]